MSRAQSNLWYFPPHADAPRSHAGLNRNSLPFRNRPAFHLAVDEKKSMRARLFHVSFGEVQHPLGGGLGKIAAIVRILLDPDGKPHSLDNVYATVKVGAVLVEADPAFVFICLNPISYPPHSNPRSLPLRPKQLRTSHLIVMHCCRSGQGHRLSPLNKRRPLPGLSQMGILVVV